MDAYLRSHPGEPAVRLYKLSLVADEAARELGKKRDLSESLWDYERVLPAGARTFWAKNAFYSAINPYSPNKEATFAAEQAVYVPGPFDGGVDMGPQHSSAALKDGRAI